MAGIPDLLLIDLFIELTIHGNTSGLSLFFKVLPYEMKVEGQTYFIKMTKI